MQHTARIEENNQMDNFLLLDFSSFALFSIYSFLYFFNIEKNADFPYTTQRFPSSNFKASACVFFIIIYSSFCNSFAKQFYVDFYFILTSLCFFSFFFLFFKKNNNKKHHASFEPVACAICIYSLNIYFLFVKLKEYTYLFLI